MSYAKLPEPVRQKIRGLLESGREADRLEVTGSITVEVTVHSVLSFDVEFENVAVAEGHDYDFDVIDATLSHAREPVVRFDPGSKVTATDSIIRDAVEEKLTDTIWRQAEESLSTIHGVNLRYSEVVDVDIEEMFIENQSDVDEWNSTDEEVE